MRNPDTSNQTLPELMLKYAHVFNELNGQLVLQGSYGPIHAMEVNSIREEIKKLAIALECGSYVLVDFSLIQRHFYKSGFDLGTLGTLKKILSNDALEPDLLTAILSHQLKLKEYLHMRRGQQPELDRTIQALLGTIDAFSKEFSSEYRKFSLSIMNPCLEEKKVSALAYGKFNMSPLTLRTMTQEQQNAVVFGAVGGVGAVVTLGVFKYAAVSAKPAIKRAIQNIFRR
ncbi:MAG: hypothetical protein A3I77_00345 [Gammaproteobacteria bacterium RIFCSPLOWO2_02_FULL_42_14]|nr:MAG: hypothetical protein A3B71_08430 [Gammaproteobacteria bacterium RIFCSPHIGHO2_02_FULL_42_43]OGT50736.1 MAG: hypothetical protein A3E54_00625 [Gammaproteobacteria bacterium RIFCSPHIGHO2_12_FULL_41_25]OGT61722.1 MAG: hypothetical protein A3I77_00345 [Gammaproteobacteria bacterium RIFCSPLOWO2_02_FULL_42_14]OGT85465.1 MAG: hypothetical protein A3G86_06535 [Gammaproteobacteria bacterium RIFCSPLOWO2_12_FULL_42_18]